MAGDGGAAEVPWVLTVNWCLASETLNTTVHRRKVNPAKVQKTLQIALQTTLPRRPIELSAGQDV